MKRIILSLITVTVVVLLGSSLFASLSEPQISDRIELYQTDLVLRATELNPKSLSGSQLTAVRKNLLGENPFKTALEAYQEVRKSAQTNLDKFQAQLVPPSLTDPQKQLVKASQQQQDLIHQLDLRIGLLQVKENQISTALKTWDAVATQAEDSSLAATAGVLAGLWSEPPQLLPNAEPQIQKHLEGWFQDQGLTRLYQLQQRTDALVPLQANAQVNAQETLVKLAIVGALPAVGGIIGIFLLIGFAVQWVRRRSLDPLLAWEVPWTWETILQVLMIGFFFSGQIALPLLIKSLGIDFSAFGGRASAVNTLIYYVLMATSALTILYLSIKQHLPLPEGWFRPGGKRNWFAWGLGGYFVALPLMLLVSVLNQQIWQGQGGSNPLLQIVLEEGDPVALGMFFFTAAIAAPVFEEILFRGFLLPSLTRYFPVGGAIALSSLIFATAHLSLSEILPLTVLGAILGFVYTRSRGLLSSIMLHSLWNSVTMIGLFILGSGMN
ncbi:MAG: CPBP family intramembrane metalloprotease [Timaviella obliquedivisa GSE-PSE-MK23-08B]|nr:CPBP family intramembrane metalloprotease [Timaviella obliquedivisa GSE-PSE-MK23-08B]